VNAFEARDPVQAPEPVDVGMADDDDDVDGQMEWMSSRLASLINEGKKALGAEVVLKDDRDQIEEDEGIMDDGADGWRDDEPISMATIRHSPSSPSLRRGASQFSSPSSYKPLPRSRHGRSGSLGAGAGRQSGSSGSSAAGSAPRRGMSEKRRRSDEEERDDDFQVLYNSRLGASGPGSAPASTAAVSFLEGSSLAEFYGNEGVGARVGTRMRIEYDGEPGELDAAMDRFSRAYGLHN